LKIYPISSPPHHAKQGCVRPTPTMMQGEPCRTDGSPTVGEHGLLGPGPLSTAPAQAAARSGGWVPGSFICRLDGNGIPPAGPGRSRRPNHATPGPQNGEPPVPMSSRPTSRCFRCPPRGRASTALKLRTSVGHSPPAHQPRRGRQTSKIRNVSFCTVGDRSPRRPGSLRPGPRHHLGVLPWSLCQAVDVSGSQRVTGTPPRTIRLAKCVRRHRPCVPPNPPAEDQLRRPREHRRPTVVAEPLGVKSIQAVCKKAPPLLLASSGTAGVRPTRSGTGRRPVAFSSPLPGARPVREHFRRTSSLHGPHPSAPPCSWGSWLEPGGSASAAPVAIGPGFQPRPRSVASVRLPAPSPVGSYRTMAPAEPPGPAWPPSYRNPRPIRNDQLVARPGGNWDTGEISLHIVPARQEHGRLRARAARPTRLFHARPLLVLAALLLVAHLRRRRIAARPSLGVGHVPACRWG